MKNQKNNKALVGAILFAAVIVSSSLVFFGLQVTGGRMSDEDLKAAIFEGIDAYIANEQEKSNDAYKPRAVEGDFTDDDAVLGNKDAPVTLVEFSDYECPYCSEFYSNTFPQIKQAYIETGKVKFIYRDYPIKSHRGAYPSALIAECVRDQEGDEAYYEMHDRLFETIAAGFNYDSLSEYAVSLGADATELKQCFDGEKFKDEIYADLSDGVAAGIDGTPGFVLGGKAFTGARSFDYFAELIDAELENN